MPPAPLLDLHMARVVRLRLKGAGWTRKCTALMTEASKFTAVCHSTTSPKAARTDTGFSGLRTASTRKCCRKMLLRVRLQHVQDMVQDVLLVRYFY
jgi:hypothetical protein